MIIMKLSLKNLNYKYLNYGLIGLILVINCYLVVSPFLPQLDLWKRKHNTATVAGLPYKTKLDKKSTASAKRVDTPTDNRLVIPSLALNQHIYTGSGAYLVNLGVWARPSTSTPPNGSNTVMIAHRFTYNGPSTFYSLDKIIAGDKVVVYWQAKEYDYTVSDTKTVDATDLAVEDPTPNPILTLYTCTPLWTAEPKYRIVVTATLDSQAQ